MLRIQSLTLCLLAFATSASSSAQIQVVGVAYEFPTRHMFTTTIGDFVGDYAEEPGAVPNICRGIDFNAAGTLLYGIQFSTGNIGVIDEITGGLTGIHPTGLPASHIQGLTSHPDGFTWYAIGTDFTDSQLYRGSIGGPWVAVGSPMLGVVLHDIACNSEGELFGESIHTDSLYSIDPVSGTSTIIGPFGIPLNASQGFDFDWTDDTLYATFTLQIISDGSRFVAIDTDTAVATVLADTSALFVQAEMAIKHGLPCESVGVPFCDPNELHSGGVSTQISGCMPGPGESGLHLEAFDGPPGQFGYFLVGTNLSDPGIVISEGRMCLSTAGVDAIGRYNMAGTNRTSIGQFNALGVLQNLVGTSVSGSGFDVPAMVPVTGLPPILAGETWHFQLWHRDPPAGPTASNFSNGLSVTF